MRRTSWLAAASLIIAWSGPAAAAGFHIDTHDAEAIGRDFAYAAGVDDASALYYNPAAIGRMDQSSIRFGWTILSGQLDWDPDPGEGDDEEFRRVYLVPNGFASFDISEIFDAGIGVFAPFNLATDWPDGWAGRYQALTSEVTFLFIQPAITLSDPIDFGLSLSFGPELVFASEALPQSVRLTRALDFRFLGAPDGHFELEGESAHLNVGYMVALHFQPAFLDERVAIGVTWRATPDDHEIVGDAKFRNVPAAAGLPPRARASTEVTLPPWLQVGLQVELVEDVFWLELGYKWIGWSTLDELVIEIDTPGAPTVQTIDFDWHDASMFMIGAEVKPLDWLSITAGYFHDETPVPGHTLSPRLPDADRNGVSIGVGLELEHVRFHVSYMHLFFETATKDNLEGIETGLTANGQYDTYVDIVAASLEFRF